MAEKAFIKVAWLIFFFFICTKIWSRETGWKCRSLLCHSWYLWSVSKLVCKFFGFTVCVRPPQFSVPFFFPAYPWQRSSLRQSWLQQLRLSVKPFLAPQWNGWMGSLVQLIHQTPWSEQPIRLQELQLCTQARRSCTFFCVHLNASHAEPKSFSSNPITRQVKTRLAVCLLTTLQGIICFLTFYGQRSQLGHPRERDKPGWAMLGQEPKEQQQQDTGRKEDSQKETVSSHAGLQLGAP